MNNSKYEEIPELAKYLPDLSETADLIAKTVPPTKCSIKKGIKYDTRRIKEIRRRA